MTMISTSSFFFNDTATTEIYTLSLHDALPISRKSEGGTRNNADCSAFPLPRSAFRVWGGVDAQHRSEAKRALVALLLYGSGLRLLECLSLRVKDVDFHRGEIRVRGGKGGVDRVVPLPVRVQGPLADHLGRWRARHARDVERGGGRVVLPGAFERKVAG